VSTRRFGTIVFQPSGGKDIMIEKLKVRTPSHSCFVEVTSQVERIVAQSGVAEGICFLYVPHTTAAIAVNENADPTVRADILKTLAKIIPWEGDYSHSEGNSAAHIKASLFGESHFVPVSGGKLALGTWQGIFLAEFDGPRTREVWIRIASDRPESARANH
jgi:secondary thiamine-phosphate synthase enzyme